MFTCAVQFYSAYIQRKHKAFSITQMGGEASGKQPLVLLLLFKGNIRWFDILFLIRFPLEVEGRKEHNKGLSRLQINPLHATDASTLHY